MQQAVVGMGAIIGSAVLFTWSSGAGDVKALEKQRNLRHHASGKVRDCRPYLLASACTRLSVLHWATPASPVLYPCQYVDGDEELIKKLPSRALSIATPQSPEQIMKLQTLRHESTGKY